MTVGRETSQSCDDARFINLGDALNFGADVAIDPYGIDLALRDIAEGEELTVDYVVLEGVRLA